MPYVATKDGSPIIVEGVVATNCECCTCYTLSPAVCCDDGPGPVRYRVRGTHSTLATAAAGSDPIFVVLRPDGFELGPGDGTGDYTTTGGGVNIDLEDTVEAECWYVEESEDCDEGEWLDWIEFDGTPIDSPSQGEYTKGNIESATVLIDDEYFPAPEECEQSNLDNCPVIVCGECVSASSVISTTINVAVNSTYLSADVELDASAQAVTGCAAGTSAGAGEVPPAPPSPTPYPSSETTAQWSWSVACDGTGYVYLTLLSWETPTGVLRGQGNATFDADGNITPVLEVDITFPATLTATWSIASPVAWTKVGSDCFVEEAP